MAPLPSTPRLLRSQSNAVLSPTPRMLRSHSKALTPVLTSPRILRPHDSSVMDMDTDLTDEETETDMDMDLTTDEEPSTPNHPNKNTPQTHRNKNALSPAAPAPASTSNTTNADDVSDSDLSEAMDMDSTEDEMEMPKAVGPIKQGFSCMVRGNHVGIRLGKPRLWVPPQGPVGDGDETEVEEQEGEEEVSSRGLVGGGDETEVEDEEEVEEGKTDGEEEILPSMEELTDWSPVFPQQQRGGGNPAPQPRGAMPSNPITISDSTDEEEEEPSRKTHPIT
ncbi:MAG: hypothetical protein Q9212_006937, partial [Teloschistes hypoglaucus]